MLEGIGLFIAFAGVVGTVVWLVIIVTGQEDAVADRLFGKEK
jgi:hypothetical protein